MKKLLLVASIFGFVLLLSTGIAAADNKQGDRYRDNYIKDGHYDYPGAKGYLKPEYKHHKKYKYYDDHEYSYKYNKNNKRHYYDDGYYYSKRDHGHNKHYLKHRHGDCFHSHYYTRNHYHNYGHRHPDRGFAYINLFPYLLGYFQY